MTPSTQSFPRTTGKASVTDSDKDGLRGSGKEFIAKEEPVHGTAPINILIVDDEVRNLEVLESVLESPEYNLIRALNADRALMLLIQGDFAVIVLDIQMPKMNGIELASLVKQRKRTQHIPIIFLTAYYQDDKEVLEGYGTGAVDYLTKPINPQILRSKIAVFVDLYRKTRALAATNCVLELEVTQRQHAEEALRRANSELEARVQARTNELLQLNNELRDREKALKESQAQVQHELAQQKRSEEALRASETQLRLVTDHAPVSITQLDRAHRFKFVNRTYAQRFNLQPEELIGKHLSEVLGQPLYEAVRHRVDSALSGQRTEFEIEVPTPALGRRWVHVIQEPERTPNGEVIGLVVVINDVTERKIAEREMELARDKAMAASRAKDDFLARLSHELRTPLNPVLLLASEAANNTALPETARADFQTIVHNVTLEARLIDDLLDLTSITHGKITLELRPSDVHTILLDALAMMRADIAQKNLQVLLELGADRYTVLGDEVRLKQVFLNILKNAVKFTPDGGMIKLETSATEERVMIKFTDSGLGMTKEEIDRVFVAFSQGDHAKGGPSHRFGGLGLGLAISRVLVEQHSGLIRASSPGRNGGTTFLIEFPLSKNNVEKTIQPTSQIFSVQIPSSDTERGSEAPRRILLVEDHKPTRSALTHLLIRRQYEVVGAGCVAEARAIAQREVFDLVISDIGLPDGSGYELMAELRDHNGLTGIALTGYGMEEDVDRSLTSGFAAHLTKPVNVDALDSALSAANHRKRRIDGV